MQLQQQTERTILLPCFSKVGQDAVLSGLDSFLFFQAVIGVGGGAAILNSSSLPDKIHYPFAPLLLKLVTCPDKHQSRYDHLRSEYLMIPLGITEKEKKLPGTDLL